MKEGKARTTPHASIRKAATGIQGRDEVTEGGFPAGRPTLVCGGAGAGKTMLATEFLVRGATEFDEPGVYVMFEERVEELSEDVGSSGGWPTASSIPSATLQHIAIAACTANKEHRAVKEHRSHQRSQ